MTLNCRLNFRDNKVESVTSPIGGDSLLYRQLVEKYGEDDGLDMMYIAASEDAATSLSNYLNEQGEPTLQALERYVEAVNIENKGEVTLDDRSLIKTLGASLNTSSLRTISESLLRIAETGVNNTLLEITPQEALDLHHRIQNTEGDISLPEVGPNSIISEGEVKTIDEVLEPHLVEVNTREEFDEVVNDYAPQEFLDEYNSETPMSPAEEMRVIKDKAIQNNTFLKAPNGEDTNLTERQWLQTRTKAFKEWFGDWQNNPENASKVVDENGEPMVVYHGTDMNFNEFDISKRGTNTSTDVASQGFFFSRDKEVANSYKRMYDVTSPNVQGVEAELMGLTTEDIKNISTEVLGWHKNTLDGMDKQDMVEEITVAIENDSDIPYIDSNKYIESIVDVLSKRGVEVEAYVEGAPIMEVFLNIRDMTSTEADGAPLLDFEGSIVNDLANSSGHRVTNTEDQVTYTEKGIDTGTTDIYIVKEPNQIKSATDNIGDFSSETSDIRFQSTENSITTSKEALQDVVDKLEQTDLADGVEVLNDAETRAKLTELGVSEVQQQATEEVDNIIQSSKEGGTYMKAPNGEQTNLTENQWATVRTENFKRWFGDWQNSPESASKILDENGEPLVVYHGTDKTFSEFIANYAEGWGTGMYFTDNSAQASQEFGSNVIGAFLKITKPFDGSLSKIRVEVETTSTYNEYIKEGWNKLTDSEKEGDYDGSIEEYRNDTNRMAEFMEAYEEGENTDSVNDALKEMGYDGIVAEDSNSIDGLEIVAFESNQIKSSTENSGEFSSETGNIYKQADGVTQTPNGFVHDGKVYINSDKAGLDTPIHEFGHLWNTFIKRDSPEVYKRGLELVEGTEYLRDVENNPAYDNLNKEQKLEEALAQAIGEKGVNIENETKRNTFIEWINELFDKVANALGIRGLSPKELSEISLDEYTSLVSAELLSSRPIQGSAELFSSTSKNMPRVSGVKVFQKADTEISYRDLSNHIVLELIQTPQEARGEGQAQSAMNDLAVYADQTRKPIYLDAVPRDSETNESRLRGFYERNGFTFDDSMVGPGSGIPGTSMVRYPKRVTRTEGTMADTMFQSHMETSVVRHYNTDMTPATEPNMITEILETLDTNKSNNLIEELRTVYEKPTRSINKVDVDAIIEAGIEAGVNLSDMNEVLTNKGQTSLQDLAGSLMYLVESPSNDTLEATTELYTELLPNKVKEKVTRERLEGTDTEVIVFDGHVDKRQAFEEASLVEVGDGIYKRVETIEDSDVARNLYDDFTDNLSSKVSQEMITDSKKHMTRAQLVEHVMNKPRAESEMHLREFYEGLGEEYTDRQIKLQQMLNDNVVRERPLVREMVSERTVVAEQQSVDKFHENKLKNSIENNAKYRGIYRYLVVTTHGLTLTPIGERRIGDIMEMIQTLPVNERKVLMDAISQSRASNVKALLIQDNTTPVTLDSIVTNAQNNIESLKEFKGIYEISDGYLTTKEGGDMLIRVGDRLFLKDNDNGTESTYKEINVYNEGDIVVDNVLDSIRDPRHMENTSQESENNTTHKNQENKIKEKEC